MDKHGEVEAQKYNTSSRFHNQLLFTILDTTFHDANWLLWCQALYNFYNTTNQLFVTIPGTNFPDATDKLLVTSLSNKFMLLQINCLSQFQAQTNYLSPGRVLILCCYRSTACYNPRHHFAQYYRQFARHQSEH